MFVGGGAIGGAGGTEGRGDGKVYQTNLDK
jgi:hypothetical protein